MAACERLHFSSFDPARPTVWILPNLEAPSYQCGCPCVGWRSPCVPGYPGAPSDSRWRGDRGQGNRVCIPGDCIRPGHRSHGVLVLTYAELEALCNGHWCSRCHMLRSDGLGQRTTLGT